MYDYTNILKQYWGYNSFRPLQEEIIKSVLEGRDTLGLMPTGGGKSLTFQVPALTLPGICVVVTPLIALMQDQVENLKKLGIKATAIHSGCSREEIDVALNNCLYAGYKFLYISPERISSEIFRTRFQEMNVNLITVDEAHCISQWGYDFRPSYLKISALRQLQPTVPVLALSATATPAVVEDIIKKLLFNKPNFLKASFRRENLIYAVKRSENKDRDIYDLVMKLKGSGIIYARSRRKCVETAANLAKAGVSAEYYHAGLDHSVRMAVQQKWTVGKTRVIVATNAFGMGIDKADVQFVIHLDLPDSPEAYFQEAGRAGRDGKKSFAILLYGPSDKLSVQQRININFPDIDTIKKTYSALGNYFRLPIGAGKGMSFDFNLQEFARNFRLSVFSAYSIIKILEICGYLELTDEINNPSRIKFLLGRDDLYKFQVSNAVFDSFIKLLLRSYTGVFTEFTAIDETFLAKKANVNQDVVKQYLTRLQDLNIIRYIPRKKTPILYYAEERLDEKALFISKENYNDRKERYIERAEKILQYAEREDKCRSQLLLEYFGEVDSRPCGECDVCRNIRISSAGKYNPALISRMIIKELEKGPATPGDLAEKLNLKKSDVIDTLRIMTDKNLTDISDSGQIRLKNQ